MLVSARVEGVVVSWSHRRLEGEPIMRLILGGTVAHTRLDRARCCRAWWPGGLRAGVQKVLLGLRAPAAERGGLGRSVARSRSLVA